MFFIVLLWGSAAIKCGALRSFVCVGGWGNVLCERAPEKEVKAQESGGNYPDR